MTASMMHASAESPTAPDRHCSHRGPLGGRERDPGAGSARLDRDWQLLEALRLHAPTAAERLVVTYGDRAYRLAVRITGNQQDAEEAVQDAFWRVVRKIDTFRGDSAFGSWLYRIVSNTRRSADVPRHLSRSWSTRFCPRSMRMGVTSPRSGTGHQAWMTRRCKPNFGPH